MVNKKSKYTRVQKTMANKKSKYTGAQKRAYYSGMGYATAYHGKEIKFETPENRESFVAGWKKGTAMVRRKPDKYPSLSAEPKKNTATPKRSGEKNKATNAASKFAVKGRPQDDPNGSWFF